MNEPFIFNDEVPRLIVQPFILNDEDPRFIVQSLRLIVEPFMFNDEVLRFIVQARRFKFQLRNSSNGRIEDDFSNRKVAFNGQAVEVGDRVISIKGHTIK